MNCAHCGATNPSGARFCMECGAELARAAAWAKDASVGGQPASPQKSVRVPQNRRGCMGCLGVIVGLVVLLAVIAALYHPATQNAVTVSSTALPTTAPTTGASDTLGNFDGYVGALAQEIRICGLAAHQLTWHHTEQRVQDVFPEAATPRGGCTFAADNISYDSVPDGLDALGVNSAAVDAARHKLEKWARLLAQAYGDSQSASNPTLSSQAEDSKTAGLAVIVAAARKLGRSLDAATLLPSGTSWND